MGWTSASLAKLKQTHKAALRQHYDQMDHAAASVADDLEDYAKRHTRWHSKSGTQVRKITSEHGSNRSRAWMYLRGGSTTTKWGTHNVLASLEFGTRPHRIWARRAPGRFGLPKGSKGTRPTGQSYSPVGSVSLGSGGAKALTVGGKLLQYINHPGTRPYMTLRGSWQANARLLPRTFDRGMQAVARRFGA